MSVPHLIFVHCADACTDPHLRDVFMGLAYGMHPFCVQADAGLKSLVFRRSHAPTEKDRAQRLAVAVEELAAIPAVQAYNARVPEAARLRVLGDGARPPAVAWGIADPTIDDHLAVVPALLAWTQWDRDAGWIALRRAWAAAANAGAPPGAATPRPVRLAQALDVVGKRATAAGHGYAAVQAVCQEALRDLNAGQREIVLDDDGAVRDVV
jgi:hypothetical protein